MKTSLLHGSDKNISSGSDENIASGSNENIASGSEKNTLRLVLMEAPSLEAAKTQHLFRFKDMGQCFWWY